MTLAFLRRSVALVLALALFAPGSAFGRVLFECAMSGKVSAQRCCCHRAAAKAHAERRAEPPKAERPSCCEAQDHRRATVPASSQSVDVPVLAAAQGELLPAIPPLTAQGDLLVASHHGARGPPPALPVYAVNCSLLI